MKGDQICFVSKESRKGVWNKNGVSGNMVVSITNSLKTRKQRLV